MLTPQTQHPKLAQTIGLSQRLYFKREDLHPLLSHKGRSLPIMINNRLKTGINNFVVSSSGNAAIASALYISQLNKKRKEKINLQIFVGEKIDLLKLKKLKKLVTKNITLTQTKNPKQSAFQLQKNNQAVWLRQSTDDTALLGYHDLAKELSKIKNLSAVFIPTSSGTTALGLDQGFKKLKLKIQIHIVQTAAIHPIVQNFSSQRCDIEKESLATAIVDKIALRKLPLLKALKTNRGYGWVEFNQEIKNAIQLTNKTEKIQLSSNSALAVAALQQAIKNNWKFTGPVVCLITGQ
ncbi:MAG: PLP-dependent lyase/thiolase [Candidatus Magasanikbacteria bacterium]|nr:PLP-dependent lyase/thiolase [Candidatus Magasanikbacteria bacterium]